AYAATNAQEGFAEVIRAATGQMRERGMAEMRQIGRWAPMSLLKDVRDRGVGQYGLRSGAHRMLGAYSREFGLTPEAGVQLKVDLMRQTGLNQLFEPGYARAITQFQHDDAGLRGEQAALELIRHGPHETDRIRRLGIRALQRYQSAEPEHILHAFKINEALRSGTVS